jgi:hypothetical protein
MPGRAENGTVEPGFLISKDQWLELRGRLNDIAEICKVVVGNPRRHRLRLHEILFQVDEIQSGILDAVSARGVPPSYFNEVD